MRRLTRRAVAIGAAVATSAVALAGPAAADHFLDVHPVECGAGEFSDVGFPSGISTKHVKIKDNRDGTVTATCTFKKIPATLPTEYEEDGIWDRPSAGTVYTAPRCFLSGDKYDHLPVSGSYGVPAMRGGTMTWGSGGKAVATCTFDLVEPQPEW